MASVLTAAKLHEHCSSGNMPVNAGTRMREAGDYLHQLHLSPLTQVEDGSVSARTRPPCRYKGRTQIALPYFGVFRYKLGTRDFLVDSNCVLIISDQAEFEIEHAVSGVGHSTLVINPSPQLLDEIVRSPRNGNNLQGAVTRPAPMGLRLLGQRLLQHSARAGDPLYSDELVVRMLQEIVSGPDRPSGRRSRAIDRAKQVLHERSCERLSLEDISNVVGVSPVYLTQEFARSEGLPLYRYQLQLRLSHALIELPHCSDITGLAFDLGFSSHSHFTSVFRKTFGLTPSDYRALHRRDQLRLVTSRPPTPASLHSKPGQRLTA